MTESAKRVLWRERVMAFDRSGLQRGVWCARHGFKLATLDYWRQQLAGDVDASAQRLIPIRVNAAMAPSALGEIKIEIGGGIGLQRARTSILIGWRRCCVVCADASSARWMVGTFAGGFALRHGSWIDCCFWCRRNGGAMDSMAARRCFAIGRVRA